MIKRPDLSNYSLAMTYTKLTLMALLWGGTFIAGKILANDISALNASTARFIIAVIFLLFLSWKLENGLPKLNLQQIIATLLLGLTGVFAYNIFFFQALSHMPASRTAVFVAFNPIAVAILLSVIIPGHLSIKKWFGIIIALLGVLIVISQGQIYELFQNLNRAVGTGELAMIFAVLSWAVYTIIGRFTLNSLTPLAATTYAALFGTTILMICSILDTNFKDLHNLSIQNLVAILYLAIGGTVIPFLWYYQGIQSIGPTRSAVFTNLVPVFGVFLGAFLLEETIATSTLIGGAIVLLGVKMTNS